MAVVYGLNRDGGGMSDFEQALVVRTLCRDHRLSQVEVALALLSRQVTQRAGQVLGETADSV